LADIPRPTSVSEALALAGKALGTGRLEEAEACCGWILAQDSGQPDALHLLGLVHLRRGRNAQAADFIGQAARRKPNDPFIQSNLGSVLRGLGRTREAVQACRKAVDLAPARPESHLNLAAALKSAGQPDESLRAYADALRLAPGMPAALYGKGVVLQETGKLEDAVAAYRQAVQGRPDYEPAWLNLGAALTDLGRAGEAADAYRRALALNPKDPGSRQAFAACLAQSARPDDPKLPQELLDCLQTPGIEVASIRPLIQAVLRQRPYDQADPLLLAFLARDWVSDAALEAWLTEERRAFLQRIARGDVPREDEQRFLVALAIQCFRNEYVFEETEAESEALDDLVATPRPTAFALLGAYRRLSEMAWVKDVLALSENPILGPLIRIQVEEPQREREIRPTIAVLTPIRDAVSTAVRSQYEENPYPRWDAAGAVATVSLAEGMTALFPHLKTEAVAWPARPAILNAGCGTGRHPIVSARRYAGCSVLAVDLSLASLAFARRKAESLKLANVDFAQADILELGAIDHRFDVIESFGVLHHLDDPLRGWRVLRDLLKPGGFMHIALYSERGRAPVVAARALIDKEGLLPTLDGIRCCRTMIRALPEDHPAKPVGGWLDFMTTSACRDLLFHVREHRFTLPQIEAALCELGLDFLGFAFPEPQVLRRYRAAFPDDPTAVSLANWQKLEDEDPALFANTYPFWLRRPA
jgi:tetratricopeptide (TPR) repeat protein/SAM-dependent methyltransferase